MRVNYVLYPSLALNIFSNKENVNLVMSFNICWGIKFQPSSETGATTQHRSWVSVPISHQLVQSLLPAQTRSNFRWKLKINWMARRTLNFFQFVGGRIFMMIGIQKCYPSFCWRRRKVLKLSLQDQNSIFGQSLIRKKTIPSFLNATEIESSLTEKKLKWEKCPSVVCHNRP